MLWLLFGGGLAGRAMYAEHQRNQAAAEHAKQEKLMNDKVTSHADKTYGNKWILDTELSGKTAEQITPLLKAVMQKYSERKVTITVDGEAQTYSMKDCKKRSVMFAVMVRSLSRGRKINLLKG